jgi:sugar phosphate isomerase/epimerase
MTTPPLGMQTLVFSGRYQLETDADTVYAAVAAAGFTAVETQLKDAHRLRDLLAKHGLRHGGIHLGGPALRDPKPWIDLLKVTGARDVCQSGLMDWNKRTRADYDEAIAVFNEVGKRFRDEGIHLHYHNHDFEFLETLGPGGPRGIDYLAEKLDPAACDLCVDVAWVLRGNDDPAAFLLKHAGITGYLHFKDTDGTDWKELGRGKVDFASVINTLPRLPKVRWIMWEQDKTEIAPEESTCISRTYLKERFGL